MLYYLSEFSEYFIGLNVFKYVTFRAMGAALTTLLVSLIIGPKVIEVLTRLKLGQPIRGKEEVHKLADLHGKKRGTPTMGGVMILITLTLSCLLWGVLDNIYLWLVLIPTLLLGVLGFIDDFKKIRKKSSEGISSRFKLVGQIIVGLLFGIAITHHEATWESVSLLHIPFVKGDLFEITLPSILAILFFIVVIVGTSNAVNLTDGLDGLATGCVVPSLVVFSMFSYVSHRGEWANYLYIPHLEGIQEVSVFCGALAGSCLGFLWFNCHPAKMFMGDTGSLALGGALATIAICVRQELLLVICGGVFVMEAMSVILQVASFKLTGKRIFAMSPIHHHFELKGWSETSVVTRFWILSFVFGVISLASLKLR